MIILAEGFPYLKIGYVHSTSLSRNTLWWNDFDAATRLRAMLNTKSLRPVWEQLIAEIPQIAFEVEIIKATAKKHGLIITDTGHISQYFHR